MYQLAYEAPNVHQPQTTYAHPTDNPMQPTPNRTMFGWYKWHKQHMLDRRELEADVGSLVKRAKLEVSPPHSNPYLTDNCPHHVWRELLDF